MRGELGPTFMYFDYIRLTVHGKWSQKNLKQILLEIILQTQMNSDNSLLFQLSF